MADRYFIDSLIEGDSARLAGSEAHHLAHVMRAQVGLEVMLFDGHGSEFRARVECVGRAEIELTILDCAEVDRELDFELTLGVASPKGDRQRWLVEKLTELGVTRVVPLTTERSNDRESRGSLDKLRRAVIEASKQCGRNRLLEIGEPTALSEFLSPQDSATSRVLAHPGGTELSKWLARLADAPARNTVAAIGPEGGFSDREVAAAREAGWQTVTLGPRILRIETAAVVLASAIALRV